jgi:hypothetical protein
MSDSSLQIPADYGATLKAIAQRVRQERARAVLAVNSGMILLYWDIGRYALRGLRRPVGVSQWETTLAKVLPASLAGSLPSIEELEAELGAGEDSAHR